MSASFDDIRKGNLHNGNIIFAIKSISHDKLSPECDQQFYYKELSNEKCATLVM
jgi:hypothetical protein